MIACHVFVTPPAAPREEPPVATPPPRTTRDACACAVPATSARASIPTHPPSASFIVFMASLLAGCRPEDAPAGVPTGESNAAGRGTEQGIPDSGVRRPAAPSPTYS